MKTLRDLLRDGRFRLAVAALLVFGVLAFLSFFSPYDPREWRVVPRSLSPSWNHLLGTNSLGQDVFWQLTFAVRNSLFVAFLASALSRAIAMTLGMMAGYSGRIVDRVITLAGDVFLVIPLIVLLILLMMLVGRLCLVLQVLLFGLIGWGWDLRLIRSQILSLRERGFTYTAILSGTPTPKLIFNEYIPFLIPLVLATFIAHMGFVVGLEITLAFIGLTDLAIPTIGSMLQWALVNQALFLGFWWWLLTPIVVALVLFIALYLASVSISEYLDPRARVQRVGGAR